MADVKVSQLTEATSVGNSDYLMLVQGGESKKVSASMFIKEGDSVSSAESLNGYTEDDFLGAEDTAKDSDKLGGVNASEYARKEDISFDINDYTWCMPRPWYFNIENTSSLTEAQQELGEALVNNGYVVCDGRRLDKTEYKQLYDIIGDSFNRTGDLDDTKFRIPDLRGRFIFGANMAGTEIQATMATHNLPMNVYSGDHFLNGQWVYPETVGVRDGDPTTTQEKTVQMAQHSHAITENGFVVNAANNTKTVNAEGSAVGYVNVTQGVNTTNTTQTEGINVVSDAVYPPNDINSSNYNYGMLSMPPFVSFCYIMRIRK